MIENTNPVQTTQIIDSQGNGLAVASLVLGILGIVLLPILFWVPFLFWILGILSIIFGAVGVRKPSKKGMAKAGLILGIITIVLQVVIIIIGFSILSYNM